jgi:tetratricopeptide (TPR) repeat protein
MSRFRKVHLLCAVLLMAGGISLSLAAKPPDLPAPVEVDCREEPAGLLEGCQAGCRLACEAMLGCPGRVAVGYLQQCRDRLQSAVQGCRAACSGPLAGGGCGRACKRLLRQCTRHAPCQLPPDDCDSALEPVEEEAEAIEAMPSEFETIAVPPVEVEVIEAMPVEVEPLEVMPAAVEESETPAAQAPESQVSSPTGACPYRRQQQESRPQRATGDVEIGPDSVLCELEKLKQAARLCAQGDAWIECADYDRARQCFDEARQVCPGSRWEALAVQKLAWLARRTPEFVPDEGSEQEEPATAPAGRAEARKARLEELLRRCQQALEVEDYTTAEKLARRAAWACRGLKREKSEARRCRAAPIEEEAEVPACWAVPGPAEEVARLLAACHQAINAGDYSAAAELARQARALDPASVAADALVFKTHMLSQLQKYLDDEEACSDLDPCIQPPFGGESPAEEPCEPEAGADARPLSDGPGRCDTDELKWIAEEWYRIWSLEEQRQRAESGEEPAEPRYSEPDDECLPAAQCPQPPAVDPLIVQAMQRLLDEVESARLQEPGSEEEECEPQSCWPYRSFDGMPGPDDAELELVIEEEPAVKVEPGPAPSAEALGRLVQQALGAIQQSSSVDVELGSGSGLRYRCTLQIGGAHCRVLQDRAGRAVVVICTLPPAIEDPRAAQRAHEQEVLDWIEAMQGDLAGEEEADQLPTAPRLEDFDLLDDPETDY